MEAVAEMVGEFKIAEKEQLGFPVFYTPRVNSRRKRFLGGTRERPKIK